LNGDKRTEDKICIKILTYVKILTYPFVDFRNLPNCFIITPIWTVIVNDLSGCDCRRNSILQQWQSSMLTSSKLEKWLKFHTAF